MRRYSCALRVVVVGGLLLGSRAGAQSVSDLQAMSIGQLETLDVTSVTKTREDLSDAPAAIYVITHDDIVRSGAATAARNPAPGAQPAGRPRPAPAATSSPRAASAATTPTRTSPTSCWC